MHVSQLCYFLLVREAPGFNEFVTRRRINKRIYMQSSMFKLGTVFNLHKIMFISLTVHVACVSVQHEKTERSTCCHTMQENIEFFLEKCY